MIAAIFLSFLIGGSLGLLIGLQRARLAEQVASTDTLTGLYNRAFMDKTLGRLLAAAKRDKTNLTVAMVDLNKFKIANDSYGHQFGDQVLHQVAKAMAETVRRSDFIFRYGGDEFVLLLPHTSARGGERAAHKLISRINALRIATPQGDQFDVGVSVGLASFPEHAESDVELIKCADGAVYLAKGSKNHMRVAR